MMEDDLIDRQDKFDSIYFNKLTCNSALLSAGGAIDTCKAVVSGHVKNAIAVIRPPGHHAEFDQPMGFCIFDNVSIAARVCQAEFPELCRKVLIVDWCVIVLIISTVVPLTSYLKGMSTTVLFSYPFTTQQLIISRQRNPAGFRV